MAKLSYYTNHSKTWKKPRNYRDIQRNLVELQVIHNFGLKNKREVWRTEYFLAKIKKVARDVMLHDKYRNNIKYKKYLLVWFCFKYGFIYIGNPLHIVGLKFGLVNLLYRRIQTLAKYNGLTRSIYESRILILHKKITVKNLRVNKPSMIIKKDNELKIQRLI